MGEGRVGKPEVIAKSGYPVDKGEKVWALSSERAIFFSKPQRLCLTRGYVSCEELLDS